MTFPILPKAYMRLSEADCSILLSYATSLRFTLCGWTSINPTKSITNDSSNLPRLVHL
jgi:hypothetical protein